MQGIPMHTMKRDIESKPQREQAAADRIYGMLPGGQGQALRALWEEFEAGETDDAKFANAVDRTQPFSGQFLHSRPRMEGKRH